MNNFYNIFMNVIEFDSSYFYKKNKNWYFNYIDPKVDNKYGMIVFYSTNCIKCKQMKEFWSELAIKFNNAFFFGAVNCSNYMNQSLIFDLPIEQYPIIYLIDRETRKMTRYLSNITPDDIQILVYSKIDHDI
jgi:thiol-disulfide isomerase/thioredoxin